MTRRPAATHRVVIAGGGVAALEALLALRALAGDRTQITVVAPQPVFVYRPVTVGEAFARSEARTFPLDAIVADRRGDQLVTTSVERVEPEAHRLWTSAGTALRYDSLVLAIGARPVSSLPGALTFRGREDVGALTEYLDDLTAGRARSIAYVVPATDSWPLPVYELALMTRTHLDRAGATARTVWLVTPEPVPLSLFGPAAVDGLESLLGQRNILLRTGVEAVGAADGILQLAAGDGLPADRVVTLPTLEGPGLAGIPVDELGFIPVDGHGRVDGFDCVYAAGDATCDSIKQGGLATQQADAAAEAIAADAGAPIRPQPYRPVLRGLLMTGHAPLYLRADLGRLGHPAVRGSVVRAIRQAGPAPSAAAGMALWWPPAKIAGRYLSPYLASVRPAAFQPGLVDRAPVPGAPLADDEYEDAVALALLLADCDARWGDVGAALEALDAAEALEGSLPPEYEAKRRAWRARRSVDPRSRSEA